MAEKNVKNNAQKTEEALSGSEAFFLKYKKAIIGGVIAIIAVIALWVIIDMFVITPNRIKGQEALELYKQVKEKYFNSMQYQIIDAYIERASN